MAARTELKPLNWGRTEGDYCENVLPASARGGGGNEPGFPRMGIGREHSLFDQCERLRTEIKRGKEHLDQVRSALAESRARLEEWPAYERACGCDPLASYTQSLVVNERIEQFLSDWLQRRQEKLEILAKDLEPLAQPRESEGITRLEATSAGRQG